MNSMLRYFYAGLSVHFYRRGEPPHLNWSTVIFRKRRTKNDKQTTKARRDYLEVTAS